MEFYPIENDGVRFLLPESSVSMVANYDSRYCVVYLNGVDVCECRLPLYRGKFVIYVLKSNLYDFFGSASAPQSLGFFLNGEHDDSYYFIGENGYEIDGHEKRENGNDVKANDKCLSW